MPVVLPPDLTTKLAAVNALLGTISQAPVASLDASLSVDVALAVNKIDEVDRSLQTKGWHWNREDSLSLTPNASGEIVLPSNYLWVGSAYWMESGIPVRVSERARKLYNRDDHSFVFSAPVVVDLVVKLVWEEMPEYARQYIALAAMQLFQANVQGTAIIERVTEKEVQGAMALIEQREDEAEEQNNVGGNRYVGRIFNRGPRRRW